jgi:membrane protein DedA with SNARE-associated domain
VSLVVVGVFVVIGAIDPVLGARLVDEDNVVEWLQVLLSAAAGVVALALCKWRYWRAIDATPLPFTRGDAIGVPVREATLFERPMTESNYITREMAFVLARRHARRFRGVAIALIAVLPGVCLLFAGLAASLQAPLLWTAALSALAGAFAERWLFFAQARHLVTLYY